MKMNQHLPGMLAFLLITMAVIPASVSGQKKKAETSKKPSVIRYGNIIEIGRYVLIPDATEPSTPEEIHWWEQIRNAHAEMLVGYKKRKENVIKAGMRRFFHLLFERQQRSYRVLLKDRPPLILIGGTAGFTYLASKHKTEGTVELSVEFRPNGSVGDIQVVEPLDDALTNDGLTRNAVEAASRYVFLPAIKD